MEKTLLQQVEDLVNPVLGYLGFRLIEREFVCESGEWKLRLYIDKEGGVNIDDCSKVSRAVGDVIEVEDLIDRPYALEVSSPGINRPLRYLEDFESHVGKVVKVKTKEKLNGRAKFKGELEKVENDTLFIRIDDEVYNVPYRELLKANVEEDFHFGKQK
ncbi:MAG: ribosome maturation factor RimP [Deltaproteobacteria bacterium CG11_big_fil_rev_8_21_14_0_20_42_23]|nr:MAG: ribosome maturation factor RimP [Deltaproteobacteria bacterium CG11_big_fil_rev_8_21_14_0_20_42_23]PJC65243.1 MAG: ribosome maturation factor RimP [Deltaproteobacteria bacterium CG_4_9_14_0_2_um_filter_42_21]